jgi:hypothetical protein
VQMAPARPVQWLWRTSDERIEQNIRFASRTALRPPGDHPGALKLAANPVGVSSTRGDCPVPTGRTEELGFPIIPTNPFRAGRYLRTSLQFPHPTNCRFVRLPDESDSAFTNLARTFAYRFSPEL